MTMTMTTITTITTIGMMTMTEQTRPGGRLKGRSRGGSADKIWAAGLAGVTCVGLVGTIGVRFAQEAAANPGAAESVTVSPEDPTNVDAVSVSTSTGLTEQQLDMYARALEEERVRLEAYHAELLDTAAALQQAVDALAGSQSAVPARASAQLSQSKSTTKPKKGKQAKKVAAPAAKPVPKPAAAPQVVKPQAQTRGS